MVGLLKRLIKPMLAADLSRLRRNPLSLVTKVQITLEEARFLGSLVTSLETKGPIVEIGTLFGASTRVLCLFKSPDRPLLTVDNYSWNPLDMTPDEHHATTAAILGEAVEKQNVRQPRMDKKTFYESYNDVPPALVFLDADHTYEALRADIEWARDV